MRAKELAAPSPTIQPLLWQRVLQRVASPVATSIFAQIRAFLSPAARTQQTMRQALLARLAPAPAQATHGAYKWVAAFAVVLIGLRASPFLFLAPQSIADSAVIVTPTRGEVSIALHGLWQPVASEVEIANSAGLQTAEGEATIMLHDDGNVRLASNTTVVLHDLSDRPEPVLDGPTLTLSKGTVWLQGLVPDHLRGLTVATPSGDISVHAGSVSVFVDGSTVTVEAWDRHAVIHHDGTDTTLVAGERMKIDGAHASAVVTMEAREYERTWVSQNLQRDAVHQREIAQLQQERRAARAGILPNSPLYAVKRAAETVDVLLTLNPAEKVQKRLEQASTRLNEAGVLLAEGHTGATVPLEEYRQTLIDVATGSGGDSVTQFLVRQEVAENASQVSAVLPGDESYLLKKAVLEASAELSQDTVDDQDVQGVLLVDTLDVLREAVANGDTAGAEEAYATLEQYLPSLMQRSDIIKPDIKKEALSLLSGVAQTLKDRESESGDTLAEELEPYLPPAPRPVVIASLSEEQLNSAVESALRNVFELYRMPRSRENALRTELQRFAGHADEGRFLRRLYHELPDNSELKALVRRAIQKLREEQLLRQLEEPTHGAAGVETGSGGEVEIIEN